MTLKKNVILCGFMGCGKSTVGRLLAQKLEADFIDMDKYIEAREQKSVTDLFALYGEEIFRQREHEAALELSQKCGTIIAAGGGALLFTRNSVPLKESGVIVFLDCSFEACYSRIEKSDRPLVRANSKETLEAMYLERRKLYLAVSDFTLSSDEDAGERAEKIISFF